MLFRVVTQESLQFILSETSKAKKKKLEFFFRDSFQLKILLFTDYTFYPVAIYLELWVLAIPQKIVCGNQSNLHPHLKLSSRFRFRMYIKQA